MSLADVQQALERWSPPKVRDELLIAPGGIDSGNWSEFFETLPPIAGQRVTPDSALRVAAVYACIRILAGVMGSLPLPVFERTADARRPVKHPLWWLLNEQPNGSMTAVSFWEYVIACQMLYGDGFAVIRRNKNGVIQEFVPVHPSAVTVVRRKLGPFHWEQVYAVSDDGEIVGVPASDMLHFPGMGYAGERSLSVIQYAARSAIGIALSADQHSGNALAAGLVSRVALEAPAGVRFDEQQINEMRRQWMERYGMVPTTVQSALPIILAGGLTAKQLTITPQDAQLLESRKFQVVDIARAFGVPPFMIGETEKSTSWGSGLEQQVLGFVKFTLTPHLRRMEQELNRKIWPVRERYFTEFNINGLLRGDAASRKDFYRAALGGAQGDGWMSVNEVRKLENLEPVEGGDELYRAKGEGNESQGTDPGEPEQSAEEVSGADE